MSNVFKAACVQMRTGLDVAANIAAASALIREAKGKGADFIATPEMTSLFEAESDALFAKTKPEADDLALKAFRALAHELKVWLLIGSLPIRVGKQFTATRKLGKTHQNVLVFVKGDPQKATEACGVCEFGEIPAGGDAASFGEPL